MDSKFMANIGNRKNFFEFTQKPIKIIMGKPLKSPKFKLSRIVRPILVKTLLFPLHLHVCIALVFHYYSSKGSSINREFQGISSLPRGHF